MQAALLVQDSMTRIRSGGVGRMRKLLSLAIMLAAASSVPVYADQATPSGADKGSAVKLRITIGAAVLTATLEDTPAARDFASLLPLTLTLRDYAGTEKISDLPRRLSTEGAPAGIDPSVGDITYYAPWGNLTLFYNDFTYLSGLLLLGKLDSGADVLNKPASLVARFELAQ